MNKKWYNNEISPIFSLILVCVGLFFVLLMPIYSIECLNNTCSIYSRTVLLRSPILIDKFNKSDIEHSEIREFHYFSRKGIPFCHDSGSYYQIYIYLKQREISVVGLDFNSSKRAKKIYNNMINNNDFKLEGNIWKAFCKGY